MDSYGNHSFACEKCGLYTWHDCESFDKCDRVCVTCKGAYNVVVLAAELAALREVATAAREWLTTDDAGVNYDVAEPLFAKLRAALAKLDEVGK